MSRHRIVRSIDVKEECDHYYSSEEQSFDDDICLSPVTEAQFTYNRSERPNIGSYLNVKDAVEDTNESENCSCTSISTPQNSISFSNTEAKERIQNGITELIANFPVRKVNFQANPEKIRELEISKNTVVSEVENQKTPVSATVYQKPNIKFVRQFQNAEEIYKKERGHKKSLINLVTVGHVDAGKSTLMGHLLYRLGQVSKRTMHKFEQDSKKLGKSSFMYAWILDETSEERNRGITMDVAQSMFETPHRCVMLLDAPGHKDFIPNMITGAAQADVAILVVDSTRGEFETGFEAGGQTREHTMLIRSLGVSQVTVAVNKMDNVNWSEERFKEIKSKMSSFLKTVGFKESDIIFVPCSGLTGENLMCPEPSELKKWYDGPTLVDVIDSLQPPQRPVEKPLRVYVNDVFKGVSGGFCLAGKIESGFVKTGDKVLVMPAGEQSVIKGITIDDNPVLHCFSGDQIVLQLSGIDINSVSSGSVLCDIEYPIKVTSRFEARLVLFNISIPITKGFPVILHFQSICEEAIIRSLILQLNRSTGELIKRKPRCLTKNSSAVVEIEVGHPICIELYKDFKDLGRFMLRHGGSTIGAGLITVLK